MVLFGIFGALGLALVTVGIYGVIANAVARRTREIGVRIALGATIGDVVRLVLGKGARLVAIGIVLGCVGAIGVARYFATLLRGGSPYDPIAMLSVVGLLAITGIVASWVPARRAARTSPVDALRSE